MPREPVYIPPRKLVVLGSPGVGKSSLISACSKYGAPDTLLPKVLEKCIAIVDYDGKKVDLELEDTAADDNFRRLFSPSNQIPDAVIVCYAVNDRGSFEDVRKKWIREYLHLYRGLAIILVGCKMDLRDSSEQEGLNMQNLPRPVTTEEGEETRKAIWAHKTLECSTKDTASIAGVLQTAVQATRTHRTFVKRRAGCSIL